VHLKIDTGMERVGVHWYSAGPLLEASLRCPHVQVEGIYSHLANSDLPDEAPTRLQRERFSRALAEQRAAREAAEAARAVAEGDLAAARSAVALCQRDLHDLEKRCEKAAQLLDLEERTRKSVQETCGLRQSELRQLREELAGVKAELAADRAAAQLAASEAAAELRAARQQAATAEKKAGKAEKRAAEAEKRLRCAEAALLPGSAEARQLLGVEEGAAAAPAGAKGATAVQCSGSVAIGSGGKLRWADVEDGDPLTLQEHRTPSGAVHKRWGPGAGTAVGGGSSGAAGDGGSGAGLVVAAGGGSSGAEPAAAATTAQAHAEPPWQPAKPGKGRGRGQRGASAPVPAPAPARALQPDLLAVSSALRGYAAQIARAAAKLLKEADDVTRPPQARLRSAKGLAQCNRQLADLGAFPRRGVRGPVPGRRAAPGGGDKGGGGRLAAQGALPAPRRAAPALLQPAAAEAASTPVPAAEAHGPALQAPALAAAAAASAAAEAEAATAAAAEARAAAAVAEAAAAAETRAVERAAVLQAQTLAQVQAQSQAHALAQAQALAPPLQPTPQLFDASTRLWSVAEPPQPAPAWPWPAQPPLHAQLHFLMQQQQQQQQQVQQQQVQRQLQQQQLQQQQQQAYLLQMLSPYAALQHAVPAPPPWLHGGGFFSR
jgi:hypothetical protein